VGAELFHAYRRTGVTKLIVAFCSFADAPESMVGLTIVWLVAFAQSRRAPISFVISVLPSVRMYQRISHRTDFHEIWHLRHLWKSAEKVQIWLKLGTLLEDLSKFYWCWRNYIATKALSSTEMVSGFWDGRRRMRLNNKGRRHSVMWHVLCLSS